MTDTSQAASTSDSNRSETYGKTGREDGRTIAEQRFDSLLQLAGLSLFLATVEMLIPKPMPFLKLGIANLPILLFVRQLSYREILLLIFLKVFCQSLISGTMLSYILVFSACAGFVSGNAMWFVARLSPKHISLLGISILGAACSNGIQLVLALSYFFPGTGSLLIPWSLSFGLGSGVLLGLFALQFSRHSKWYKAMWSVFRVPAPKGVAIPASKKRTIGNKEDNNIDKNQNKDRQRRRSSAAPLNLKRLSNNVGGLRFGFGVLSLALMFGLNKLEPIYLGFELLLFIGLNLQLGYRPWWRSMFTLFVVLVFFHLLLPSGRLLWELDQGPIHWRLTQGALERGIGKAFFLLNLIQISRFAVSPALRLPGRPGHIVQLVFRYYEGFLNCPVKFRGSKPFASLDAMLCLSKNLPENLPGSSPGSMDIRKDIPDVTDKTDTTNGRQTQTKPAKTLRYQFLGVALLLQIGLLLLATYFPLYRLFQP
ncbi:Gx transporter family protein [Candidatus Haliotispira prima]|uniref:Gx transporter family protein n=1 Tax=Candidatus Haliotispira prima TaxID=3034016 RepID=A0ABY8MJN2_9SPIO|nr:Gx transporter family protein [Candidatus Haliotispira prima]